MNLGKTDRNYAELYFIDRFGSEEGESPGEDAHAFNNSDTDTAEKFKKITGKGWITELALNVGAQKLFHFLFLQNLSYWNVSTPEDIKRGGDDDNFFRYAGLDVEAYVREYQAAMREVIEGLDGGVEK
jgi:hypothetical protein